MRAAIFINPASGNKSKSDEIENIEKICKDKHIDAVVFKIPPEQLKEKVKKEMNEGYDAIVAAGGDGTVNSVASVLCGSEKLFGVIPLGTLNHFAKDLKIPLTIPEALDVILKRKCKQVDVAEVNNNYFVNNSSIGLYPQMIRKRDAYIERLGTGKWVSLVLAFFKIFRLFPLYKIEIEDESGRHIMRSPFVFIGNNEYKMNVYELGIREHIDKGNLMLYYAKCKRRFCIIKLAVLALLGKLAEAEYFEIFSRKTVTILSRKSSMSVSIDGEVKRLMPPLKYKIHPKHLNVIVP